MPLNCFALNLYHFAQSTLLTSTASLMPPTMRFADASDRALGSTPSFPSLQVIHEELVNYCRILSITTKIELPGHSGS
jgi:hypothetical protein